MQVSSQEIGKRIKDGKGVYGWRSLRCLKRYFDKYGKCKFILASESGECDEEEYAGIIMSHFCWYEWKPACFFFFTIFWNLLAKMGFGATLSTLFYNSLIGHRQAKK